MNKTINQSIKASKNQACLFLYICFPTPITRCTKYSYAMNYSSVPLRWNRDDLQKVKNSYLSNFFLKQFRHYHHFFNGHKWIELSSTLTQSKPPSPIPSHSHPLQATPPFSSYSHLHLPTPFSPTLIHSKPLTHTLTHSHPLRANLFHSYLLRVTLTHSHSLPTSLTNFHPLYPLSSIPFHSHSV